MNVRELPGNPVRVAKRLRASGKWVKRQRSEHRRQILYGRVLVTDRACSQVEIECQQFFIPRPRRVALLLAGCTVCRSRVGVPKVAELSFGPIWHPHARASERVPRDLWYSNQEIFER